MLSEPVKAALISGGIQLLSVCVATVAAWAGVQSWKRSTLGNRQIELVEENLLIVWKLDERIKAARMLLPPIDLEKFEGDGSYHRIYTERYESARARLKEAQETFEQLKRSLLLAEFYLGSLPRVRSSGETRFFAMDYKIVDEYDEVINLLFSNLFTISSSWATGPKLEPEAKKDFASAMEMFYGFMYEYEKDDYSFRLENARRTFERHVRGWLCDRSLSTRTSERLNDAMLDRLEGKFKPTTTNKYPINEALRSVEKKLDSNE